MVFVFLNLLNIINSRSILIAACGIILFFLMPEWLSDQCKELEEKIEWERLEISSRKLENLREHFMQRGAQ